MVILQVEEDGAPIIGDNVDIGAEAKVHDPIPIGNDALISVNAIALNDVPDDRIAVGVLPVVKPRGARNRVAQLG